MASAVLMMNAVQPLRLGFGSPTAAASSKSSSALTCCGWSCFCQCRRTSGSANPSGSVSPSATKPPLNRPGSSAPPSHVAGAGGPASPPKLGRPGSLDVPSGAGARRNTLTPNLNGSPPVASDPVIAVHASDGIGSPTGEMSPVVTSVMRAEPDSRLPPGSGGVEMAMTGGGGDGIASPTGVSSVIQPVTSGAPPPIQRDGSLMSISADGGDAQGGSVKLTAAATAAGLVAASPSHLASSLASSNTDGSGSLPNQPLGSSRGSGGGGDATDNMVSRVGQAGGVVSGHGGNPNLPAVLSAVEEDSHERDVTHTEITVPPTYYHV